MTNNILFVDDEAHILKAMKRGLYNESYNKFFANSGAEAIEILKKEDIHVIVSDMKMPKMTGLELLTYVKEEYPDIVKIILSGYTQLQQIIVTINRLDIYKFITKPFDIENEFRHVLLSAINLYNTRVENRILKQSVEQKNALYQNILRHNSERIDHVKLDFKFIQLFHKIYRNYNVLLAVKMKNEVIKEETYKAELDFIHDMFDQVIKKMPSVYKKFDPGMLKRDLTLQLAHHYDKAFKLNMTAPSMTQNYYGNYNLILFSVFKAITYYFEPQDSEDFDVTVSEVFLAFNKVNLIMDIQCASNQTTSNKLRGTSLKTFLGSYLEAFEGSFAFDTLDDRHIAHIQLPLIKQAKEGDSSD